TEDGVPRARDLWRDLPGDTGHDSSAAERAAQNGAVGAPGSHSAGANVGSMPATPELLAAVAALPEPTDEPVLGPPGSPTDLTAPDPGFALRRLLRPVRVPLALSVALVAASALTSIAYPSLARLAVDGGITAHAPKVLALAGGLGLVVGD